jgi:hypothetical protein
MQEEIKAKYRVPNLVGFQMRWPSGAGFRIDHGWNIGGTDTGLVLRPATEADEMTDGGNASAAPLPS